jgi:hypothetical protein
VVFAALLVVALLLVALPPAAVEPPPFALAEEAPPALVEATEPVADADAPCEETLAAATDCVCALGTAARARRTPCSGVRRTCFSAGARRTEAPPECRAVELDPWDAETSAGVNVIVARGATRLTAAASLRLARLGMSQSVNGTSDTAIRCTRRGSGIDLLVAESSGTGRQASTPMARIWRRLRTTCPREGAQTLVFTR